jgi:hypothetical protein
MPEGFKVFETTGAWESYSTPARDLRLLIAIDVVTGFAEKVKRQPAVFGVPAGDAAALAAVTARLATARDAQVREDRFNFEYTRSDGSKWKLSLADLIERAPRLEAAYNPNDCPEHRWGAEARGEEGRTCKRHAPADQADKMQRYKEWFRERKRPARDVMKARTCPGLDRAATDLAVCPEVATSGTDSVRSAMSGGQEHEHRGGIRSWPGGARVDGGSSRDTSFVSVGGAFGTLAACP